MTWQKLSASLRKAFRAPSHTADAGGCSERFERPGIGCPASEPAAFTRPPAELFSLEREKHVITQKPSWIECSIEPKTGKVDDFRLFSQNPSTFSRRQNAKSMISSCFPEIHRLSAKKGLGTGEICRPKGRSASLACCLSHAGGWKCGQGQATRWVVACRGASGPLDSAARRWHPRPEQSGGRKYARQLTGARRCPAARADVALQMQAWNARQIRSCGAIESGFSLEEAAFGLLLVMGFTDGR